MYEDARAVAAVKFKIEDEKVAVGEGGSLGQPASLAVAGRPLIYGYI